MGKGSKILAGLQAAVDGDMTRVHIEGQTWVRHDAGSPEDMLMKARDKIADLTIENDRLAAEFMSMARKLGELKAAFRVNMLRYCNIAVEPDAPTVDQEIARIFNEIGI